MNEEQALKAFDRALCVIHAETLKIYLTSNQWVQAWNDIDIVDKQGRSFRLDRLVEFDDHLAIIDYKLTIPKEGTEQFQKYSKQLQGYQAELARIRTDKPAKAFLISAQGEILELS